jgi:crotonobetainyl-CoA:carnitine CoA-transferase CaiB-like acyl-CoA transferase
VDARASATDFQGYLGGVRVLEIGNELGEYCGKVLAGLGADVVRLEPPGGEGTRSYGPFYRDEADPNRSLYFWQYNLGKRSVVLDLDDAEGRAEFARLAESADVIVESRPRGYMHERGLGYEQLKAANPRLVYARISPFGDSGPWADYEGGDLVHLALGGVMMNCGYDPDPAGFYETPPIAPQMWQSYHIAGEMCAMAILGALNYRLTSGEGQALSTSVHDAVSKNTETDLPDWIFLRQTHRRLTCRHSIVSDSDPALSKTKLCNTKDGRYLLPYRTYVKTGASTWEPTVALLKDFGMEADLEDPKYDDPDYRYSPEASDHISMLMDQLVSRLQFSRDLWRDAQAKGLPWAPIRRPEENVADEHWQSRGTFVEVHHDELDQTFTYVGPKWLSESVAWCGTSRAPLIGEHTDEVLSEWVKPRTEPTRVQVSERSGVSPVISRHGTPFALSDVRVVDLSWMLASAGAGRFLSAMGAEVIKVEHESRPDGMRYGLGVVPPGGRAERDRATGPIPTPPMNSPNRGGSFMEINAGKLGMSLNLKHPRGREVLEELIRGADMVVEGFSPGTMIRMGLGYDRLKELNPGIIYVQQSGFGEAGTLGRARAYGPTAQALSGISDMSGLPEPYPPAGIGYSYLDWFGAYNMAVAMLSALYRRNVTGQGCHIDASQGEIGLYLTGTAILDHSANGRRWSRYGNRSPYKRAAPHGAYRTAGDDRWLAISAFTNEQWRSVAHALGSPGWVDDPRFATLDDRMTHQDELDRLLGQATISWDGYALMTVLQARGVPAGVCQTAQDRYETDPQLRHLDWLVELDQQEIGRWPVKELPVTLSRTPAYMGGRWDRSGPSYGEDTQYVLASILGLSQGEIEELRKIGAL